MTAHDHADIIVAELRAAATDHDFGTTDSRLAAVRALVELRAVDPAAVAAVPAHDVGWPEPTELPGLAPVPAWDHRLLPDALRPWVADAADRIQCPAEYVAIPAMGALASVIGRGCAIRPKRCDDWTVAPNLWGAIVGAPSAMKSPGQAEGTRPLRTLAYEASQSWEAADAERETIGARVDAARKRLAKAADKGADLTDLTQDLADLKAAAALANAQRRFIVNDATVEKLGEILTASPRGVLVLRDELTGWLSALDRQGRESDRAFYLEAWNGTDSFTYDRIGRGTVRIDSACVSIIGTIQPGPLAAYLAAAEAGGVGADGLVQRFQLLVYPDAPRDWVNVDRWPDSTARDAALAVYRRLAHATPEDLGADRSDAIPFVRFDDEAQDFFDTWRAELERRLRAGGDTDAMEAHLAKYRSLMPSLALICHLADVGRGPVGLDSARRAAAWCSLLEDHARRIYGSSSVGFVGARSLLRKIRQGKLPSPFGVRDVQRAQWSGLTEHSAIEAALATLEAHGWLRSEIVQHTGGRPRVDIHTHPSIRGAR